MEAERQTGALTYIPPLCCENTEHEEDEQNSRASPSVGLVRGYFVKLRLI